jgi:tRNA/tmRNA/rRNA uracil-C5-methylase (TrmA/RlmC/RlmD family)
VGALRCGKLDDMELVELEITNVAHGGIFVARHEGRVIFVTDAVDGERVLAQITDDKQKSFWRATTVKVLEPSKHRQEHVWSAASIDQAPDARAGGAEFGHITLAHQRELKAQVLTESLERFAQITRPVSVEGLPGDDETKGTRWRTRVSLHVGPDGRVGPYAARSHNIITVRDLPLAVEAIEGLAPLSQRLTPGSRVDLVAPSVGGARINNVDPVDPAKKKRPKGKSSGPVAIPKLKNRADIREVVGDREFALAEAGFWQVHRHAAATLSSAVAGMIDGDLFDVRAANHDLYGGVGLLAAAMGDRFGSTTRMTSVESSEEATEFAANNLADWVGARVLTGRVDRYLTHAATDMSPSERTTWNSATVILDPPRAGAGKDVVESLGLLSPAQLIYVACDPVAFARDAGYLRAKGYELDELRAFDLFPNTHHVEAVARFVRSTT